MSFGFPQAHYYYSGPQTMLKQHLAISPKSFCPVHGARGRSLRPSTTRTHTHTSYTSSLEPLDNDAKQNTRLVYTPRRPPAELPQPKTQKTRNKLKSLSSCMHEPGSPTLPTQLTSSGQDALILSVCVHVSLRVCAACCVGSSCGCPSLLWGASPCS